MKKIIFLLILLTYGINQAQTLVKLKMFEMEDTIKTSIPLIEVNVYCEGKIILTKQSDFDGYIDFQITGSKPIILSVSSLGYQNYDTILSVNNLESILLDIPLEKDLEIFDYRKIYNQKIAMDDLKRGEVKIYFVGLIFNKDLRKLNRICEKYGFRYVFTTDCINVEEHLEEAIRSYNNVVIEYLELLNNKNWKNELFESTRIDLRILN